MSSIMRRRNGLMAVSVIGSSCLCGSMAVTNDPGDRAPASISTRLRPSYTNTAKAVSFAGTLSPKRFRQKWAVTDRAKQNSTVVSGLGRIYRATRQGPKAHKWRVTQGNSPPGAPRTVRKPLSLHGSRCSAVGIHKTPVGEEIRVGSTNASQPIQCPFWPLMQARELTTCPANQVGVNAT